MISSREEADAAIAHAEQQGYGTRQLDANETISTFWLERSRGIVHTLAWTEYIEALEWIARDDARHAFIARTVGERRCPYESVDGQWLSARDRASVPAGGGVMEIP